MHRRTRGTLWILAAVLLLVAVAVILRFKAPPEAASLLPESEGIACRLQADSTYGYALRPATYVRDIK
jgi:hypothetical protein